MRRPASSFLYCCLLSCSRYFPVHQQPEPTLELRLPRSTFAVRLDVILRNLSAEDVLVPKIDGHAEDYLHIKVRDSDGKQLLRIDRRTFVKNGKSYSFPKRGWGSRKLETIKPNGPSHDYLVLSDLFELSKPGAYTISAKAGLQRPYPGPEIKWVETVADEIGFAIRNDNR